MLVANKSKVDVPSGITFLEYLIYPGASSTSYIAFLESGISCPVPLYQYGNCTSVNLSHDEKYCQAQESRIAALGSLCFVYFMRESFTLMAQSWRRKLFLNEYFIRGINDQDWGRKSACCSINSKPIELMHLLYMSRCEVKLCEMRGLLAISLPLEFAGTWVSWRFVRYLAKG